MTRPAPAPTSDAAARHVPERRPAVARRVLPLSAEDAWALLTDMRNHARWIPLTRIEAPASLPVGSRFTAVSGPFATRGVPGFPDTMEVELAVPPHTDRHGAGTPGEAMYRKVGPVLNGTATVVVRPLGPDACEVRWEERVHVRGLPPALTAPLLRPVLTGMLVLALRRVAAEVGHPGHAPR